MAVKILKSYLSFGYQFFLTKNWGELHRGVSGDTTAVYIVLNSLFRLLSEFFTIVLICCFLFISSWEMALSVTRLALIQAFQGAKDILLLRKQRYFVEEYEKKQI